MTVQTPARNNDTYTYNIGDCALDCSARILRRGESSIHVEPQVFDMLEYFAKNPDRLITKDELLDAVWSGRIVSEATLSSRLSAARKAIGDTDTKNRLIATVPRHGF